MDTFVDDLHLCDLQSCLHRLDHCLVSLLAHKHVHQSIMLLNLKYLQRLLFLLLLFLRFCLCLFLDSDLARVRSLAFALALSVTGAFVAVSDCGCSLLHFVLRHDLRHLHLLLHHVLVFDDFLLDSVLTHDLWRFRQLFHHLATLRRSLFELDVAPNIA